MPKEILARAIAGEGGQPRFQVQVTFEVRNLGRDLNPEVYLMMRPQGEPGLDETGQGSTFVVEPFAAPAPGESRIVTATMDVSQAPLGVWIYTPLSVPVV